MALWSAADQSAPSAFTASSSASARLPRCLSRSTHTCCAMPVVLSSPMMATTHGVCSTTSATGTSSIRSGRPKWRRPFQGLLERLTLDLGHLGAAASGRRQARDDFRFPLNHLGIRARVPLRDQLLYQLDASLQLLIAHRLDAAGMLQLHLPRHQQGAYLHVRRGLLLTDFFNRGRPVLFEIGSEREQKISIERPTRSFQGPARVSRPPRSEFAVDALGDVVRIGLGIQGHRGILCLLRAWRITDRGRFSQQEQTISSLFIGPAPRRTRASPWRGAGPNAPGANLSVKLSGLMFPGELSTGRSGRI